MMLLIALAAATLKPDVFTDGINKIRALENKIHKQADKYLHEAKKEHDFKDIESDAEAFGADDDSTSLLQTSDPDTPEESQLKEKLQQLEEKMKVDAAKFQAMTAPQSSFLEWRHGMSLAQEFHHVNVADALKNLDQSCLWHRCTNYAKAALEDADSSLHRRLKCSREKDHMDGVGGGKYPTDKNLAQCFEGFKWDSASKEEITMMNCASEHRCVPSSINSLVQTGMAKTRAKASSFLQESPDDGFAKVEAKLKALEEKMKADAAKFEAEAKAPASSFVQTKDAPDDGFAKVEAKLKALEEKMKADAAKFEAEAKAPATSFVEVGADGNLRTGQ
jgi:hypothetical protein